MNQACSIVDRFVCGGNLAMREFCSWAGISKVTAYQEVRNGRLRITKVGRRSVITVPDAFAWRKALHAKASTSPERVQPHMR